MNARLQGSKIKRIRVENVIMLEPAAGPQGTSRRAQKGPNQSKNEPFRATAWRSARKKSM
jgi:hypothetical protein